MYALVDGNNFYASCERVFRPDLRNKPIVILSNNDGVIIARSNEAKALGVQMGSPVFKSSEIIRKHNITVFSSNFPLYGDMSNRMMTILRTFSPDIEVYSIDEAFLKLTGYELYNIQEYGEKIRKTIYKNIGIPTGIGIAPTKSLSKIANHIAKKFPKETNSVYIINDNEKRIKALKWTKVGDVWGIGRRHAKRLQAKGVNTAYDFTQLSDTWIKKYMSIIGLRLKKDLLGTPHIYLDDIKTKKSIATTRSFDYPYTEYNDLKERITTFAFSCAEKLRKEKQNSGSLMVFIHTNSFNKNEGQYYKNIIIKFAYHTNSSIDIVKYAIEGLKRIYKKGFRYKKAGVILMDFIPENPEQLVLFDYKNPKHTKLMQVIDDINTKNGKHIVRLSGQDLKKTWKMKQENLSQKYTTCLAEIIEINTINY